MEEWHLESFESLVKSVTGLRLRKGDVHEIEGYVSSRIRALRLSSPGEYFDLLGGHTDAGRLERREFIIRLTVGESYFFRDKGQFELIRSRILPELVRLRRAEKTLRIWSAGCSSGEEAYSMAMLVDELLPERGSWEVSITGTDIKEELLRKAEAGRYGEWSFRDMPGDIRRRYFRRSGDVWELDEEIRRMVKFRQGDLLEDEYPEYGNGLHDMDLILCRNVFIYYRRPAVTLIAAKLAATLRDGGYLLTGHGELFSISCPRLRCRMYPQSMVYQRAERTPSYAQASVTEAAPAAPDAGAVVRRPRALRPAAAGGVAGEKASANTADETEKLLEEAQSSISAGAYRNAAAKARAALEKKTGEYRALYLAGVAYANLGEHEAAVGYLRKAASADRLATQTYYMLAHIALENGDAAAAKEELKKAIYLSPSSVAAYLELADLYETENDAARAARMRSSALEILKSEPGDKKVEPYEDTTVKDIVSYLERLIGGKK